MIKVAARGIERRYGRVRALRGVDFDAHAGAVNVLIGENGAGKSTLMRIVAGVETPDAGELLVDGVPVRLGSIRDAAALGIGIVHQELSLCVNLSVSENIFVDHGARRGGVVDRRAERDRAAALLARLGSGIDPDTCVRDLRMGERQLVEIARALARDVSVLILDEPTSALSAVEIEQLFRVIAELKAAGVAIVYISHRMQEIEQIGDYVTVLRDGERVAHAARGDFSVAWIVDRMLGEARAPIVRRAMQAGDPVLAIRDLRVPRASGGLAVDEPGLEVRAGEVTAIYGVLGAGRTELLEAVCGARPASGAILVAGRDLAALPLPDRLAHGVQFVPEDRQGEGIFANLAVAPNLTLSILARFSRIGRIVPRDELDEAAGAVRRLGIKTASPMQPIGALSGGNQQKVLIGRSLLPGPKVLLLDEPGRGIDVGARTDMFEALRVLAGEGMAVLFSTSDLAEASSFADRILVMAGGRLTADLRADETTEQVLAQAANPRPAGDGVAA
ncbi:sugar ABC transporter ATP-binding protein [Sphingomonas turrisvirgatae]|uniref:ABC transporter domain-containing protein n=1 Tax=Sphingomonas turrisvirgatae TaxID=1888892 RepID=A0A1E3LVN3_9SPHN|nr:sugar ABC transporter ATP-binding protein [Sphingomonas turrisvirgatae]ODP37818.1 hypothetical protein BFL28_02300 [Sphingomonas turrisvirgatae]